MRLLLHSKINLLLIFNFAFSNIMLGQYTTNGNATQISDACYRLTTNSSNQAGSIFNQTAIDLNQSFAVSGTMNFGNNDGGADGIVFILALSPTSLGNSGVGIGYAGIVPSLSVEFDTWQNPEQGDPVQDHMGITSLGITSHTGLTALSPAVPLPNLEDGQDHCFSISWDANTQTLLAEIDGSPVSYTGNIPGDIFNFAPEVYFGFTSSTGGASNVHTICFEEIEITPMEDVQICQGESIQLQASPGADSYTWLPLPGLSSYSTANPTATPAVTTTYSVTIDYACALPVTDDVTVTVLPAPTALAFSNSPICPGADMQLSASGGGTYSWSGPNNFSSNEQNPIISNFTAENEGIYTVTVTNNDCSAEAQVSTFTSPDLTIIFPTNPLCQNGDAVQLTSFPTGGTWGGAADANGVVTPTSLGGPGTYIATYQVSDPSGCENLEELEIEILPAAFISIDSPVSFCQTEGTQILSASPTGGTWAGVASANGTINPSDLSPGLHEVIYTVSTGVNCPADTTFNIEIFAPTAVEITSADVFCENDNTISLTASVPGGIWGGIANAAGEITPSDLGPGTYQVSYTTTGGCAGSDLSTIEINAAPSASLSNGGIFCEDESFSLNIDATGTGSISVTYSLNGIEQSPLTLNTGQNNIDISTIGDYELISVTDDTGCSGEVSGNVSFSQVDAPEVIDFSTSCNDTQTDYQVSFEIINGEPSSYTIESTTQGTLSDNAPYTFTSDFIPSGSDYSFLVFDANACDTVVLSGNITCECLPVSSNTSTSICSGESILLGGDLQTESGNYNDTLSSINGCDSIITTTLTVYQLDTFYLTETSCNPQEVGTFTNSFTDLNGCDSTVITTIDLLPSDTTYLSGSSCNPNNTGTFTTVEQNQFGCDSTIILSVVLSDADTVFISETTCNPDEAGTFTDTFTSTDGCDSTVIATISLLPSDTIFLNDSSCNTDDIGTFTSIETNQFGCDSTIILTVTFAETDTIFLENETCDPDVAGIFTNTYQTTDGCDSTVIETITLLPSDTTFISDSTCEASQAGIFTETLSNQFGCDSTIITTVTLFFGETIEIELTSCNEDEVGQETFTFTNQFGCDSIIIETTTLLSLDECGVNGSAEGSIIPCDESTGSLLINVEYGAAPFSIAWSGASDGMGDIINTNEATEFSSLPAGTYFIEITDANANTVNLVTEIIQNTNPELTISVNSDFNGFAISSTNENDGSISALASGGTAPYNYLWSNGENSADNDNLTAGTYALTVIDAENCEASEEINLDAPSELALSFEVSDLNCFTANSGTVIALATGGVMPYSYSIDALNFQEENIFSGLNAGTYTITIEDANGCLHSEIIGINAAIPINIDLGDDQVINLGESTQIAVIGLDFVNLDTLIWSGLDSLECPTCPVQNVTPLFTSSYSVNISDENGCTASDDITIFVNREKDIFVPTAFSPNDQGKNEIFLIFAADNVVKQINEFKILNRWGEILHESFNFEPNNPTFGWDGRHNGEMMNTGVYVWYAEIEFIDGETLVFKGDVLLTR